MCYAAKFFVRENEPLAEHLTKWLSKEEREALVRGGSGGVLGHGSCCTELPMTRASTPAWPVVRFSCDWTPPTFCPDLATPVGKVFVLLCPCAADGHPHPHIPAADTPCTSLHPLLPPLCSPADGYPPPGPLHAAGAVPHHGQLRADHLPGGAAAAVPEHLVQCAVCLRPHPQHAHPPQLHAVRPRGHWLFSSLLEHSTCWC